MEHGYHETLCEIVVPTQIMAEKPEFRFFYFVLEDYNFCFENILLRLKIVQALKMKCLHSRQAMRPLGTSIPETISESFRSISHSQLCE